METPHIAYACIGIFSALFSLMSLFVKERLYIGEATVALLAGLILGPHSLGWFDPLSWGNSEVITLEISRIVLCIQIVAVAVELPRKYMKNHALSVALLLVPVMTVGWLVVGLFLWVLIPHFDFTLALLVLACVTATDPVLAAAVVGKGKFAERVPGHLRNLLTAESGCNDGMAFPFIFLSLNLVLYPGDAGKIVKDWFTLTILWECLFGIVLGTTLGYILRKALAFAENKALIDRESFLAFFVFLAFTCAGVGSMLGVDDLLVSFAAGTAFGWNGDFAKKTEESHVSTVIDLLLNLAYFVYFGAIVPWQDFNNSLLGLDVWRLVVLAVVIIFLRRIPPVMALKPVTPDIKTWREALFCGHFGPIGVGAVFAALLARKELEAHYTAVESALDELPPDGLAHYQLIAAIWPIVCFVVITSIVVHGSSVAVLALGKRLNRLALTMSFTATNTQDQGPLWMSRLQKLENASTSYSLHRIDSSDEKSAHSPETPHVNPVETSGIRVRPAGGARRKSRKRRQRSHAASPERQRPLTDVLQLGRSSQVPSETASVQSDPEETLQVPKQGKLKPKRKVAEAQDAEAQANIYEEGDNIILEDQHGEVIDTLSLHDLRPGDHDASSRPKSDTASFSHSHADGTRPADDEVSIHSMGSLRRHMSAFSALSDKSGDSDGGLLGSRLLRRLTGVKTIVKKDNSKRYYAHQVDDLLIIENTDGDIVRRYKLNRHTKTRQRSGSLMGKALQMVGIRKEAAAEAPKPETPMPLVVEPVHEDTELFDETELTDEALDEELPEETEVEKRRRLAALGHITAGRADDDEEV